MILLIVRIDCYLFGVHLNLNISVQRHVRDKIF